MEPIFGYNTKVELLVSSVYYPILCAEDMSFAAHQELVSAVSRTTGSSRVYKPRGLSDYDITVSGLTKVSNADGQISFFYLLQDNIRGTEQTIKLTFTDYDGNNKNIVCNVLIPDLSITGPATAFSNASITFKVTGDPEMDAVDPPPLDSDIETFSDWWVPTEGETTIDLSIVPSGDQTLVVGSNATMLLVERDGVQYDVITTGTPGNRQVRWNAALATLIFLNPFNDGEKINVHWKVVV
jgi:hypothetical protein